MKSIVLFINSLSSGGAERQLCFLADILAARGYAVTVTTYGNERDHYSLDDDICRTVLAPGKGKAAKFVSIFHYFIHVKTDVVVSFCQRNSFFALPALWFRRRGRVKVICGERNLTTGAPSVYEKVLASFLYGRADFIVSNSNSQENYLRTKYPHLAPKCLTIINYADLSSFRFDGYPENSLLKIGVFARYEAQKNCLRFCEAVYEARKVCSVPFQVHWYGRNMNDGKPLEEYVRLKSMIEEMGLLEVFVVHGPVDGTASVIKGVDAVCIPSLFEGFSNSIAEGICCGRPVMAGRVSDNSIMVKDGENGFLFDPTDLSSMKDALVSFLESPYSSRKRMAYNSRQIAEELFAGGRFEDSYLELIESSYEKD